MNSSLLLQFSPFILLQKFSLEEHGGKILVLEHRCPCCKTSSSSQDLGTTSKGCLDVREGCLVWKSTEEKSWFWSIDAIAGEHHLPVKIYGPLQRDIWTQEKDGKKKSNHVLGRGTSKCLICKRKRKKRGKKLEENKSSKCQKDGKEKFWGPPSFRIFSSLDGW
ncbi:uncharacterized protein CDAR_27921 [Caerostris darwini]|uniref:Uncharacterized protein n=1 Tax=Caerostris darwini TaxID=1538125 RepID=A0AAV4RDC7_9ARAC|nr:uncharacterized protein CDAR_27921 [Caerostris darwini]